MIPESTCPEEEPGSVWFPNVFSPNFDGYNDEFAGIAHNAEVVELSIYDRWGRQYFILPPEKLGKGSIETDRQQIRGFMYILQ